MNHVSMNRMATALHTSAPTYKKWEEGQPMPRPSLDRLTSLTGLDLDVLLDDSRPLPDSVVLTFPAESAVSAEPVNDYEDPFQREWQQFLRNLVPQLGGQAELAEKLEIDSAQMSRLLTGKKRITRRMMFKVGAVTGRYEWYTPVDPQHEGAQLRDYIYYHQIVQEDLAERMGNVKSVITGLFTRDSIKKSKWKQLVEAIREVTGDVTVTQASILKGPTSLSKPEEYNQIYDNKKINSLSSARARITKGYAAPPADSVEIVLIPAHLRSGFHYDQFMQTSTRKTIAQHHLLRLQNANLTPAEREQIRDRYDLFVIGNDYMEPTLRTGNEVIAFRLPQSEWRQESGVMAVATSGGRLFLGRVTENTLSQRQSLTLVSDDTRGGSLTVSQEEIVDLWKLETAIVPVI